MTQKCVLRAGNSTGKLMRSGLAAVWLLGSGATHAQSSSGDDLDFLLGASEAKDSEAPPTPATAEPTPTTNPEAQTAAAQPATTVETIPVAANPGEPKAATKTEKAITRPRRSGTVIEEIIVTAQKRAENIDEVPIAISAFSGDTLAALGVTDTRDLSRLVPGFNANESGRGSTLFTLRGVGFADTTYTSTNTVGTYIDEVSLPYSVMTRGANLDIERVEVLKGPQGTLYGRNTTGGLINYIAREPTAEFQAGTLTSYSRFNTLESENFVSGPIRDSLRGRAAFKIVRAFDGWQYSNVRGNGDTLGKQNKFSARGSLDWKPVENLLVRARVEGWRDRSDPQAPQAVGLIPGNPFLGANGNSASVRDYPFVPMKGADPQVADWAITGPFPGRLNDNFIMGSVKAIWNADDSLDLTTIVSHLESKTKGSPQLQGINVTETDLVTTADIKTNALEARLSDQWWSGTFAWSLGVNLSRDVAHEQELAYTENAGALFAVFGVPGVFGNPVTDLVDINGQPTIKQKAVFLNTDTNFSDSLSLNLGARYTTNDQHYTACTNEPVAAQGVGGLSTTFTLLSAQAAANYTAATGMPGRPSIVTKGDCFPLGEDGNNDPFVSDLNEENVSGRAALSWKVNEDSLLFASLSRGYKAGGFPVLNPARKKQLVPVVQEQLLAYEVGTKLSFFDNNLHTNLAGFYYHYKNKQLLTKILDSTFGPLPILQNAPKSTVYGFELDAQVTPLAGLYLAFAGSYVKTKINEFSGTNSEGKPQDFAGKPFNFAPELQLSVVADYTYSITDHLDLGVGGDVYYTGATNGAIDQNPLLAMDAYKIFGARIHLGSNDQKWTVTLYGRNLSNELINLGSNSFSEVVTRATGRPRTYGITINYLWD